MPLSVSLCQILQLAKNDERDITNFYIEDCVPATTEEESDSRAPDFMEALTTEDDERDNPPPIIQSDTNELAHWNETDLRALSCEDSAIIQEFIKTEYTESGLDKDATYIKLFDEALEGFVPSGDYNEENSVEEDDFGVISDENMEMIGIQLPNPGPSSGYNLELNPNTHNSCYIDAVVELLWHPLLPYRYWTNRGTDQQSC
ncbi:hypothetical protein VTP01DRAFT_8932 [Rhizomucor pusillus]|uniref:uncharacterized protein n=1 Tax=Rhizomucor pusillus TaxID=4840 RepID=UPI003744232E